jgi:hypothetical protein
MRKVQVQVAKLVVGTLPSNEVTTDFRERLEDMLLDTREGARMNGDDIDRLNNRRLAELVFIYSFGKALTKEQNGNSVMAARVFLQTHEDAHARNAARDLREAQRRRVFQEGLLLSPATSVPLGADQGSWVVITQPMERPYNAIIHSSLFQAGLIVHVLSQADNAHYFFRVTDVHNNDNRGIIILPQRFDGRDVTVYESIEPFQGLTVQSENKQEDDFALMDDLSERMSRRLEFPPCLYVGQEVMPGVTVTSLKNSEGRLVAFASVPTGNVDLDDVAVIKSHACQVCYHTAPIARLCDGCKQTVYCSDECHAFHWRFGKHYQECQKH